MDRGGAGVTMIGVTGRGGVRSLGRPPGPPTGRRPGWRPAGVWRESARCRPPRARARRIAAPSGRPGRRDGTSRSGRAPSPVSPTIAGARPAHPPTNRTRGLPDARALARAASSGRHVPQVSSLPAAVIAARTSVATADSPFGRADAAIAARTLASTSGWRRRFGRPGGGDGGDQDQARRVQESHESSDQGERRLGESLAEGQNGGPIGLRGGPDDPVEFAGRESLHRGERRLSRCRSIRSITDDSAQNPAVVGSPSRPARCERSGPSCFRCARTRGHFRCDSRPGTCSVPDCPGPADAVRVPPHVEPLITARSRSRTLGPGPSWPRPRW